MYFCFHRNACFKNSPQRGVVIIMFDSVVNILLAGDPVKHFVFMLVMINPFAQLVYLSGLMSEMGSTQFRSVHLKASLLSFSVFLLFALIGEWLINDVFQVRISSLQIFGGLIMLYIAYRYITEGAGSNLLFRGDISDLAPQISLPYMVGPGTIWLSIEISRNLHVVTAIAVIFLVLLINFIFIIFVQHYYRHLEGSKETLFGKYFAILMRTNALFIGAIAIEMILRGGEAALNPASPAWFQEPVPVEIPASMEMPGSIQDL